MKTFVLALVSTAVLSSCASKPVPIVTTQVPIQPASIAGTTLPPDSVGRVRYPEHLKEYSFGRYVDPNDPSLMHYEHTGVRVEQDSAWNLSPDSPAMVASGPATSAPDPAVQPNPYTAELRQVMELQQTYLGALIKQNDALLKKLENVDEQSRQITEVLSQNNDLRSAVTQTGEQVQSLRSQVENGQRQQQLDAGKDWWQRARELFSIPAKQLQPKQPQIQTNP